MAKSDMEAGPTGKTVMENVKRLYKARGMNLNQLSERTEELGRKLSVSALSLVATGKRRVDVDDLMALAAALIVSPATLLMPGTAEREATVEATATPEGVIAQQLWVWLTAKGGIGLEGREQLAWLLGAVPHWALNITLGTPDVVVAVGLTAEGEVGRGND
jgi:transcriptional regulator with XRE-family HTH domain